MWLPNAMRLTRGGALSGFYLGRAEAAAVGRSRWLASSPRKHHALDPNASRDQLGVANRPEWYLAGRVELEADC